ncbi:MAG: ribonuclease III [Dehalococcoidia bacterium]|nr:MAG: ribonuclease III [Dehalococcoidia bacterium]
MYLPDLNSFQSTIGIYWKNISLLEEALTHSSYVNENPVVPSNERMEFLGDALLGLVLARKLYQDYPDLAEGELTRRRSLLVRGSTLASVARTIGLGEVLFMGKGEEKSGGRSKATNLAGAMEALAAAVMLDQGWEGARDFILRVLEPEIEKLRREMDTDYKSEFQLVAQSRYKTTPSYRIIDTAGPDHDRRFTAEVLIHEEVMAQGCGRSKKLAEADAARLALAKLSDSFTD